MIHIIHSRLEGKNSAAAVSKVHILHHPKQKDDTATNTQTTKIRSVQHIQNSNFRFKSRENARGSERCEKDRTAIISRMELLYSIFNRDGVFLSRGLRFLDSLAEK
jgi:hypothetical protein